MIEPVTAAQMSAGYAAMSILHPFGLATSARQIIADHSLRNGVTVADLKSPKRKRPIVHIRQDLMLRLRRETGHSFSAIGRMLNRDHTTVLWGI